MNSLEEAYKDFIRKTTIKNHAYVTPAAIISLCFFIYSDLFLLEHPPFVYARIPSLVLFSLIFIIRYSKNNYTGRILNVLSILASISLILMGISIIYLTENYPSVYRAAITGLVIETFAVYFVVKGKLNIILTFVTSILITLLVIVFYGMPKLMQLTDLTNVFGLLCVVLAVDLVAEKNRKKEFYLRMSLEDEKNKSEDLYHETLTQNKNLEQQKEEILTINDKLEQQTEELQVNLEVISKLNGTLRKKNKAIVDSINYARRIQEAILPSREYINQLFNNCFILFKPCDIVSGDFYWFKETPQYKIVAAVDCTGHGIPGAFMSMLGNSLLNEITQNTEINTASEILNHLKDRLKESLNQTNKIGELSDGLDIALCMIDTDNKKLQFAGAYMPLCIIRENKVIGIKGDKMPIGRYIKEIDSFTNHEVEIQPNDVFYLYSDGYQDQVGGQNKKRFLSQNFKKLLLEIHQNPFEEQKNILDQTLENWSSGLGQIDDILVVGFKVD